MMRSAFWTAEVVARLVVEAALLVAFSWVGSMIWTGIKVAAMLWAAAHIIRDLQGACP